MTKKFKLKPVLQYRQILENQRHQRLAESLGQELALRKTIDENRAAFYCLCGERDARRQEGVPVHELLLFETRIERQWKLAKELEQDLERLKQEIVERRQALCAARCDKKLLEKLKEKITHEQRQCLNRQERTLLDEIALRFGRGEA